MGKSKRRSAFIGFTTCESEAKDKRMANRKVRHSVKQEMYKAFAEGDEASLDVVSIKDKRDYTNVWSFGKDGKQYIGDDEGTDLYKKAMRK